MFAVFMLCAALLAGCGRASGPGPEPTSPDALLATSTVDTDGDGVPDWVELQLGLDLHAIDSDGDGLTDHYELWGCQGLPVGVIGSLDNLPDPNGNGIIAALDPADAGLFALSERQVSAIGTERMVVPPYTADARPTSTDLDGDLIPNSYELAGFYVEYDPADGMLYFVKWDGLDYSREYYKTDPLKWSTDGDPWSDYEESTKINLDQRIKTPGDHPLIPAYPDVQLLLKDFTWEQDADVTDESGGTASQSLTASLSVNWKVSSTATVGGEVSGTGVLSKATASASVTAEVGGAASLSGTVSEGFSWNTATASNTIRTAKLTLNADVFNVGTLPASNPRLTCNLRLGGFVIKTFVVSLEGDLPAMAPHPFTIAITDTGGTNPEDIYLSLNQLRSLMSGAALTVEVLSFEADTLVSEFDPQTGRRVNLGIGTWSPYQAAIENNSARVVVDLFDGSGPQLANSGLPKRRLADSRVFAYNPNSTYFGSPPVVTLRDSLRWLCDAREALGSTYLTVFDVVSGESLMADMNGWSVAMPPDDFQRVQASPERNPLLVALRPSNPEERVYLASAPLRSEVSGIQVNWATVFAEGRKVRASISNDRAATEAVMFPRPGAAGLKLAPPKKVVLNEEDVDQLALYHAELPEGYIWSGYETLRVTDALGGEKSVTVELFRGEVLVSTTSGSEAQQPGSRVDLDRHADPASGIDDLLVSRPLGPYERVRLEALNGATLTAVLSTQNLNVDYALLRKSPFTLETLELPSREGDDFTSEFYDGDYVLGLLTSDGRIVRLRFTDLADEDSAGTTIRFSWVAHEGI